jgi:O-acetylhomoserine (thiol)-lyase
MPIHRNAGADTLALHAGQTPDPHHHSRATPIHFTTSYVFESRPRRCALQPGAGRACVFANLQPHHVVLEERIAALDGGVGAIACASGQAALMLAITTLMGSGGHIVASRSLYGGSHNLLAYTLPRFGIETTFVAPRDKDAWRAAIRPETRLLFGEAIGNPGLEVLDVPGIAEIAHEARVPLLVDATLLTPALQCPLDLGADLVMHSATKFLGGHGVAVGGLLVDGGAFDWEAAGGRFPTLTEAYEGFHGMDFAEESPIAAFLLRARREGLRDFGACLSPMNAFQILQGIETLGLRMERHVANARALVRHLSEHPLVEAVSWPELDSHPDHALAARLLPKGCGGVFSFSLKGGRKAGCAFIEALRLVSHLANVGDAKSLAIHPASTTHFRMSPEALLAAGIGEGTIRLSVGLENATDLIADLDRGLQAAHKATA